MSSYNAATGGTMVNQVQRTFSGLGQLTIEYQSHGGAVNTATTPKVQYAYSALDVNNRSRLTSMTYPNGRVITYDYGTTGLLNDKIGRLESIKDGATVLESYTYLGLGTVVVRSHPQNSVDLSYVKLTGEAVGDAGDPYTGLDRFGRIVDQRWRAGSVDKDRNKYTYDRDGNRTVKTNSLNSAFSETYTYDGLNQLISTNRGGGVHTQTWDYDAIGNWDSVTTDGIAQTRTANKQNEIATISGATTPTYDANGNMTKEETGKQYTFDAWNRLKVVKNSGGTVLVTYDYDARNYRVVEAGSSTRDLYYNTEWQLLEERVGGVTRVSNVWSPAYVDAMVARDRDADGNGSLEERLYPTHDANFNVTGLVNSSGTVVEKYAYDAFGKVTVYNAGGTVLSSTAYGWQNFHQGGRLSAESSLYHFRNRDYSATLGRWVTMDPIRYNGGDINLYGYVMNQPLGLLDFNGLFGQPLPPPNRTETESVPFPTGRDGTLSVALETALGRGNMMPVIKLSPGQTAYKLELRFSAIKIAGPLHVISLVPDPKKEHSRIAQVQIKGITDQLLLLLGNKIAITYHFNQKSTCLIPRLITIPIASKTVTLPIVPIPDLESMSGFPRFIMLVGIQYTVEGELVIQECLECSLPIFTK